MYLPDLNDEAPRFPLAPLRAGEIGPEFREAVLRSSPFRERGTYVCSRSSDLPEKEIFANGLLLPGNGRISSYLHGVFLPRFECGLLRVDCGLLSVGGPPSAPSPLKNRGNEGNLDPMLPQEFSGVSEPQASRV